MPSKRAHYSSINKLGWIRIQSGRYGYGFKAEIKINEIVWMWIKITENANNPNCWLFICPRGSSHFFEWWKREDDESPITNGSEVKVIGVSHDREIFNGNGVFNDVSYPSFKS